MSTPGLLSVSLNDGLNDRLEEMLRTANQRLTDMDVVMKKYDALADSYQTLTNKYDALIGRGICKMWVVVACAIAQTVSLIWIAVHGVAVAVPT